IPLTHKNNDLGFLIMASSGKDFFTERHLELLDSVANQISIAIVNSKLYLQTVSLKNNLENVLNSALDIMLTIAPDGNIKFFNEQFARFAEHYGFGRDEIQGKSFLKFIPESLHADCRERIAKLKSGKSSIYEFELSNVQGRGVPCLISQSPLKGRDEFLMIIKDISQVAQLQRQLVRSEKLSALGQMISGVAHELNNPLAGISGYSQLLLEEELETQVRSDIEVILRETKRCQKIVQNLLTFARKHDSETIPLDANEVVDSVLKLQSYQLKVDGIEIEERLEENLPKVYGDYQQLQQVFVHLINNARDALKKSDNSPKRLSILSEHAQDSVRIKVKDNGIGISNQYKDKIFDPFFTTKEVGEGTGLGLSICYGIVESHHGRLSVDSEPGMGSTFTLELPFS
ncbi:MAG: ATP-binding protein, partial [bacterium]